MLQVVAGGSPQGAGVVKVGVIVPLMGSVPVRGTVAVMGTVNTAASAAVFGAPPKAVN